MNRRIYEPSAEAVIRWLYKRGQVRYAYALNRHSNRLRLSV